MNWDAIAAVSGIVGTAAVERLGVVRRGTLGMPATASLLAVPAIAEWWASQGPRVFTPAFRAEIERLRPAAPVPADSAPTA